MKPKIVNMKVILELFESKSMVKVFDENENRLYCGTLGEIELDKEDILWREIRRIDPGYCTRIYLGESQYELYKDEEWKREYMCKWYMREENNGV